MYNLLIQYLTSITCLQVKESLTHVQLLLDHQLMDMAWSDNLIDCEESLLKASVHLQSTPNSSSSQGSCADSMNKRSILNFLIALRGVQKIFLAYQLVQATSIRKESSLYQMLRADLRTVLYAVGRSGEAKPSLPRAVDQVVTV